MINKENFIEKLKAKDLKALDYTIDNYSNLVFKVSYSIFNDIQLSEECTNDVMLKVWDNIHTFKGDEEMFPKWLVVITKRKAIDILRKENRHSKNLELQDNIVFSSKNTEDIVENKIIVSEIYDEVNKLDNTSKEVIIRKIFKNQRINEISGELGISKNAVSNRLLRGKKKLINALKGWM